MPYDFSSLAAYLSDETNPEEVVQLLRTSQYSIVQTLADQSDNHALADSYLGLTLLEAEFTKLQK